MFVDLSNSFDCSAILSPHKNIYMRFQKEKEKFIKLEKFKIPA